MKIIIIGAVAAGTSAAAKARRNDETAEIVIYERDRDISYSGCGLPYYIGGEVENLDELTPRDPKFFKGKYNIDIHTEHEVLAIDPNTKSLRIKNLKTSEEFTESYDKLLLATGARPFVPQIEGIDQSNVFFLRNVQNARAIKAFIETHHPKTAVIAGTGFIGLEVLEALHRLGIKVHVVEVATKITPNLDPDMASYLESELSKRDVKISKGVSISKIGDHSVLLSDQSRIDVDLVIMATGVRPNTALAESMDLKLGKTGAIWVDAGMRTSIPDIFAAGDCIETFNRITQKPVYRPLGTTANKTGRIAGDVMTGGSLQYEGNLSTGIFKIFDLAVASTGLSTAEAVNEGYDIEVVHNIKPDKATYYHGEEMVIKAIADRKTKRLLGVQIIGTNGVDKRIDVFATIISYKGTVDQIFHLDLAYAPPFSTTKDPVHYTGMILDNAMSQKRPLITGDQLGRLEEEIQIVDARSKDDYERKGHVENAINIPHENLRAQLELLDKDKLTITYCNKGVTGNAAQNILLGHGFKRVLNLSGGHKFYKATLKGKTK